MICYLHPQKTILERNNWKHVAEGNSKQTAEVCKSHSDVLETALTDSGEPTVHISLQFWVSDIKLVAWNWSFWEHCTTQISKHYKSSFFFYFCFFSFIHLESWLLKIYEHTMDINDDWEVSEKHWNIFYLCLWNISVIFPSRIVMNRINEEKKDESKSITIMLPLL